MHGNEIHHQELREKKVRREKLVLQELRVKKEKREKLVQRVRRVR